MFFFNANKPLCVFSNAVFPFYQKHNFFTEQRKFFIPRTLGATLLLIPSSEKADRYLGFFIMRSYGLVFAFPKNAAV